MSAGGPARPDGYEVVTTARLLAVASTMPLPSGPVRDRYRVEHRAELGALPPQQQIRYAVGALSTSWALRRAVTEEQDMAMTVTRPRKPLLCRLNLHHVWKVEHSPDGGSFRRCRKCGKDDPGGFVERPTDTIGGGVGF